MSSKDSIIRKLNVLYKKAGYMDKYGNDVWVAAVICISFIVFINYYYFVNVIEVVKAEWPAQRCNPLFLPFAGFIQKPTDMSKIEYTASNFNYCLNNILKDVVLIAVQPLQFAVQVIQDAVNSLVYAFNKLRQMTANLRNQFSSIVKQIYAAINNFVVIVIRYVIKTKDSLLKVNGIMTTALYTLFGSYMALISLFLNIIDFIVIILICIAIAIILFWILSALWFFIPIVGPAISVPWSMTAIIFTTVMLAILIPTAWFESMLLRVMHLSAPPLPGIPGCFAENTPVDLDRSGWIEGKIRKPIGDIKVGDKLRNGSTVTAVIKFAADEQNIYKLRGIYVTGEHRVYHNTLKWIKVKYHPESVYVPMYNEPFVYCLNTDDKSFFIGDTLFSDWDDIDEEVIEDLHKYCVPSGYLPEEFTVQDIHTHLDSGFTGDSFMTLNNGSNIPINKVKVNDVLASGDKIVGVVKIAAHDLAVYNYTYTFNGTSKTICGSKNIHVDDKTLGIINCMNWKEREIVAINEAEPFLYHFLTDSKFMVVNDIRFNDYNSGIDKYLRQFN